VNAESVGAAASSFAERGIQAVTALMPAPTDTEFFDRAGMQGTKLREQTAKDDPAEVAREGFEALVAGKDYVIAGSAKNKAQAAAGRVLPETKKARSAGAPDGAGHRPAGLIAQRAGKGARL
jgi:short-subunit dehydrogenase